MKKIRHNFNVVCMLALLFSTIAVQGMESNSSWSEWALNRSAVVRNMVVGQCKNLVDNVVNNPLNYIGNSPPAAVLRFGVATFRLAHTMYRLRAPRETSKVAGSLIEQTLTNDILDELPEENNQEDEQYFLLSEDDGQHECIIYMEDSDNMVDLQGSTVFVQSMASNPSDTQWALDLDCFLRAAGGEQSSLVSNRMINDFSQWTHRALHCGEEVGGRVGRFLVCGQIVIVGIATFALVHPFPALTNAQLVLFRRALNQIAVHSDIEEDDEL